MAKISRSDHRQSIILCCCLFIITALVNSGDASVVDQELSSWMAMKAGAAATTTCQGSIAECLGSEFNMDSEINRRILATTNYISYGALQRNTVPCSRRGASYYNCKPGAEANPYSRGCSAITRCRS